MSDPRFLRGQFARALERSPWSTAHEVLVGPEGVYAPAGGCPRPGERGCWRGDGEPCPGCPLA